MGGRAIRIPMNIESISSTSAGDRTHLHRIRQDLGALQSDLQSGNIAQAQTDFATLLDDAPALKNALSATTTTAQPSGQSNALTGLSSALQSGNLAGASTALTSLEQAMGRAHAHHHHHGGFGAPGNQAAAQTDLQSLSGALQSGNVSAAQQAFAQLQEDDPALDKILTDAGAPATTAPAATT